MLITPSWVTTVTHLPPRKPILHPTTHRFTVPLLDESKPSLFGLPGFISETSIMLCPPHPVHPGHTQRELPRFDWCSSQLGLLPSFSSVPPSPRRKTLLVSSTIVTLFLSFSLTLLYHTWRFSPPVPTRLQTPLHLFSVFDVSMVDTLNQGLPKFSQAMAPPPKLC